MKKNFFIYLILCIGQVSVGVLGSYYAFIVCGIFMIFKGFSNIMKNSKKLIRSIICAPFILMCAYMLFYSFYMFTAELDYASVRPQIWIVIPIVLTFIVYLIMFLSAHDLMHSDENSDLLLARSTMDASVEDMTIFAILLIGWLGTFVLDFYFDYAASITLIICLLKNIKELISNTHIKPISE